MPIVCLIIATSSARTNEFFTQVLILTWGSLKNSRVLVSAYECRNSSNDKEFAGDFASLHLEYTVVKATVLTSGTSKLGQPEIVTFTTHCASTKLHFNCTSKQCHSFKATRIEDAQSHSILPCEFIREGGLRLSNLLDLINSVDTGPKLVATIAALVNILWVNL